MKRSKFTNAYFELFGTCQIVPEDDERAISVIKSLETADVVETTKELKELWGENYRGIRGQRAFDIIPHFDSTVVREWIDNVSWAWVRCDNYAILKSNRTLEDEIKFLETLKSINYYSGYGIQELYGVIAFKDGSWLERGEYDGSEWWELCVMPKEPIWEEMFKE